MARRKQKRFAADKSGRYSAGAAGGGFCCRVRGTRESRVTSLRKSSTMFASASTRSTNAARSRREYASTVTRGSVCRDRGIGLSEGRGNGRGGCLQPVCQSASAVRAKSSIARNLSFGEWYISLQHADKKTHVSVGASEGYHSLPLFPRGRAAVVMVPAAMRRRISSSSRSSCSSLT